MGNPSEPCYDKPTCNRSPIRVCDLHRSNITTCVQNTALLFIDVSHTAAAILGPMVKEVAKFALAVGQAIQSFKRSSESAGQLGQEVRFFSGRWVVRTRFPGTHTACNDSFIGLVPSGTARRPHLQVSMLSLRSLVVSWNACCNYCMYSLSFLHRK